MPRCPTSRRAWPAWLACGTVLPLASAALAMAGGPAAAMPWYPAVWAGIALAALLVAHGLRKRAALLRADPTVAAARLPQARSLTAIALPVHASALGVLLLTAFATLPAFAWELRLTGGIAAAGLLLTRRSRGRRPVRVGVTS